MTLRTVFVALLAILFVGGQGTIWAADPVSSDHEFQIAGGRVTLSAVDGWERVKPRVNIIEHEFRVPATEGDTADGRITIMRAGGGVQANIDRWLGQFKPAAGENSKNNANPAQQDVNGVVVHWVDLQGTYLDKRGPFAPATERENYRMLGAVLEIAAGGETYVKFYGPQATVNKNADAFQKMIRTMQAE